MLQKIQGIVLAVCLVGGISLPSIALADDDESMNLITVNGSGQVTAQPDAFRLGVTIQNTGKTADEARETNARRTTAVINRIKSLAIPNLKLKTTGFYTNPQYDYNNGKQPPRVIGYQVSNSISITVENAPTDKISDYASKTTDAAIAAGATNTDSANFYLSQTNDAQLEALKAATIQARQFADALASAAGVKISGVHSIQSGYSYQPMVRQYAPMMAKAMVADAATPTPMEPGQLDIQATVTVKYIFTP